MIIGGRLTAHSSHSSSTARYMGTEEPDAPIPNPPLDLEKSGIVNWAGAGFAGFSLANTYIILEQ